MNKPPNQTESDPIEPPLKNHLVICGLGHVGFRIAELLHRLGEPFVVIAPEIRPEWREDILKRSALCIEGDARSESCLKAASVETARCVLIATSSDLVNLEIVLDIQRLYPQIPIVIRIFDPLIAHRAEMEERVRKTLSPALLTAPVFVTTALGSEILQTMDVSGHRLDVLEVQFDSETAARAKTVSEFSSAWNLIPLTLETNVSSETNVAADTALRAGDILTVLTDEETIKRLRQERFLSQRNSVSQKSGWARGIWETLSKPSRLIAESGQVWGNIPIVLRRAFLALMVLFVISVFLFHQYLPDSPSWIDSIYFVVTMMATVGFGDFNLRQSPWWLKLYGCGVMISGVILVAVFSGMVLDYLVSSRVDQALGRRASKLRDHVILVGLGDVGRRVAEELKRRNEPFVAVERSAEYDSNSPAFDKMMVLIGDGQRDNLMSLANIEKARAVIITTTNDLDSLRISNVADRLNPNIRCVIRINDSALAYKLGMRMKINRTINAAAISAAHFVACALREGTDQSFMLNDRLYALRWLSPEESASIPASNRAALREKSLMQLRFTWDQQEQAEAYAQGFAPKRKEGLMVVERYDADSHAWMPARLEVSRARPNPQE